MDSEFMWRYPASAECNNAFKRKRAYTLQGELRLTRLNVELDEELYRQFKISIAQRLGGKRGDLKNAIEEAIRDWIKKK